MRPFKFEVSGYFNAPDDFHVDYKSSLTNEQWAFAAKLIEDPSLVLTQERPSEETDAR